MIKHHHPFISLLSLLLPMHTHVLIVSDMYSFQNGNFNCFGLTESYFWSIHSISVSSPFHTSKSDFISWLWHSILSCLQYKLVTCAVCCGKCLLNNFWLQTELFLSAPKEIPLFPSKPKPSATPEVQHVKPGNCAHHFHKLVCREICSLKISKQKLPKKDRSYATHEHTD